MGGHLLLVAGHTEPIFVFRLQDFGQKRYFKANKMTFAGHMLPPTELSVIQRNTSYVNQFLANLRSR
jgi:hypothetical protein